MRSGLGLAILSAALVPAMILFASHKIDVASEKAVTKTVEFVNNVVTQVFEMTE